MCKQSEQPCFDNSARSLIRRLTIKQTQHPVCLAHTSYNLHLQQALRNWRGHYKHEKNIMSHMLETVANSTHGSTDVLTRASGVETGYPRDHSCSPLGFKANWRSYWRPACLCHTNMAIRHFVIPLFHSCKLNQVRTNLLSLPSHLNTVFKFRTNK